MRVLIANKFLFEHGGAERTMFVIDDELREAGHETIHLAMRDARNRPTAHHACFLPPVRHDRPAWHPDSWRAALRALGCGVRRPVRRLLRSTRPDVALLHNVYHQLGAPALLDELARARVPTVLFLHDYKVVCPVHSLLRGGEPCEACAGGRFSQAVRHRCGGSLARAVLLAWETRRQRARLGTVAHFVAPSRFLAEQVSRMGFPHPVTVLRNPVHAPAAARDPTRGRAIGYAGRLSPEKGLDTLVAAAERLPAVEFRLAGDGPWRPRACQPNLRLLGRLDPDALAHERAGWRAAVLPALWYENCPNAVLEAFADGLPVVASDRGALPELVEGRGLLFPAGDAAALAEHVLRLIDQPQVAGALGGAARAFALRECSPARHRDALERLLAELVG